MYRESGGFPSGQNHHNTAIVYGCIIGRAAAGHIEIAAAVYNCTVDCSRIAQSTHAFDNNCIEGCTAVDPDGTAVDCGIADRALLEDTYCTAAVDRSITDRTAAVNSDFTIIERDIISCTAAGNAHKTIIADLHTTDSSAGYMKHAAVYSCINDPAVAVHIHVAVTVHGSLVGRTAGYIKLARGIYHCIFGSCTAVNINKAAAVDRGIVGRTAAEYIHVPEMIHCRSIRHTAAGNSQIAQAVNCGIAGNTTAVNVQIRTIVQCSTVGHGSAVQSGFGCCQIQIVYCVRRKCYNSTIVCTDITAIFSNGNRTAAAGNIDRTAAVDRSTAGRTAAGNIHDPAAVDCGVIGRTAAGDTHDI